MLININNAIGVCHARDRHATSNGVSEGIRVLPNFQTTYSTRMEETQLINDPRSQEIQEIRQAVRALCAKFGENYWLELDRVAGYPTEFVKELTQSGFLTLFPTGIATPLVSSVNFSFGESAVGNGAIVPLADQGVSPLDHSLFPSVLGTGTVHMVLDVTGFFQ